MIRAAGQRNGEAGGASIESSGTYNFTAQVVDSTGTKVTAQCSITVIPAALALSCASSNARPGVSADGRAARVVRRFNDQRRDSVACPISCTS